MLFSVLQPLMLIVPDVQDVYTPLETDVVVPLSEVRFYNVQYLDRYLRSLFDLLNITLALFC